MNHVKDIKQIEIFSLKEKIIITAISLIGCMNLFNAYLFRNEMGGSGYLGMSLILFSAAGFLLGFIRTRFSKAEITESGVIFTADKPPQYFLSAKDIAAVEIRKARKRYAVSLFKEDGGFVDLQVFFTRKNAENFLTRLNFSVDKISDVPSETEFSENISAAAGDGNMQISWRDSYSGLYGFSLASLFSGIVIMSGGILAGNLEKGFFMILLIALLPWIILLHLRFRKRKERPALFLDKNKFAFGKEIAGEFILLREIDRKRLKSFRYSYDLTTSVQSLLALYEDDAIRISLPGLSLLDALPMCKKLNELIKQEY